MKRNKSFPISVLKRAVFLNFFYALIDLHSSFLLKKVQNKMILKQISLNNSFSFF